MSLWIVARAVVVFLAVAGVLAPLLLWLDRRARVSAGDIAPAGASSGPATASLAEPEWLAALRAGLRALTEPNARPPQAYRVAFAGAPLLAVVPLCAAFALIPFAGTYRVGEASARMVASDGAAGLLVVLGLSALASTAPLLAGWAAGDSRSLQGAARAGAQLIAAQLPLLLSVLPMVMIYGTLQIGGIGDQQGDGIAPFGLAALMGLEAFVPGWLATLRIPAWGLLLQPFAFLLFFACSLVASGAPPFDAGRNDALLGGGAIGTYRGISRRLFRAGELLQDALAAALVVHLFLGAWHLPGFSQPGVIAFVARFYGEGVATGFCALVHAGVLVAKLALVLWLQRRVRSAWPSLRSDQLLRWCWRRALPLALVNLFVTAALLQLAGGL